LAVAVAVAVAVAITIEQARRFEPNMRRYVDMNRLQHQPVD
jgi:hypothetical protein